MKYCFSPTVGMRLNHHVYIISNPRSGTTFLHRLFNLDDKRFCTPLLYHTLFPCIFWIRLFDTIALIDSKIGGPLHALLGWIERKVFKGMEGCTSYGIHDA